MRRTYHFHGPLKKLCPEPITVDCESVIQGLEMITRQMPQFAPNPVTGRLKLRVKDHMDVEELLDKNSTSTELHVCPDVSFGKNQGFIQIALSAVLITASLVIGMFNPAAGGFMAKLSVALLAAGIGMGIGGIMSFLTPQPKLGEAEEETKSRYLPQTQNTVAIGTRIPILYGTHRVGGHILSLNVDATGTT
jgi:predicted phage tail protein